ncbi:MAG: cbb3-type cytochrome oxidase assembly protein CcoS [Pseudomonadota bacterium]
MEILYVLIPLGIVLVAAAAAVLVWAVHSGQYDALDEQQRRVPD